MSFPSSRGTRSRRGRIAPSFFRRRVGLHACACHWRGEGGGGTGTTQLTGARQIQMDRVPRGRPNQRARRGRNARRDARVLVAMPRFETYVTYRAVYFWGGDASHSLSRRDDAWHSRRERHAERIFRNPRRHRAARFSVRSSSRARVTDVRRPHPPLPASKLRSDSQCSLPCPLAR